jgi:hypothetical protein
VEGEVKKLVDELMEAIDNLASLLQMQRRGKGRRAAMFGF